MPDTLQEKVAKVLDNLIVPTEHGHYIGDMCEALDAIIALFAEERAALEENLRSHAYKRDIALERAKQAEAREAKLVEALEDAVGAVKWGAVQAGPHRISPDGAEMFRNTLSRVQPVLDALKSATEPWRGPWVCEKCWKVFEKREPTHFEPYNGVHRVECTGTLRPYDRRKEGKA